MTIRYRIAPEVTTFAAAASIAVTKQPGTAAGDFIFIFVFCDTTSSYACSGFTVVTDNSFGALFWRKADGTEGASFTVTGLNVAHAATALIATVAGAASLDAAPSFGSSGAAGSFAPPGVTIGGGGDWLLWIVGNENAFNGPSFAMTAPAGMRARASNGAQAANANVMIADQQTNPAGATGSLTGTATSTAPSWCGTLVSLIPLPPPSRVDLRSELYLGPLSGWNALPATGPGSVLNGSAVQITRGRQSLQTTMTPSSATFTLNNGDGRFTLRNPTGPYFGLLVQDTPARFSLPAADAGLANHLRLENSGADSASIADSAGLQITGPIDIRVDCWPSDYSGSVLAAKWGGTAQSWMFGFGVIESQVWSYYFSEGQLVFYWFDGANIRRLDCDQQLPYYNQRIALRVQFTPSTGVAIFYWAPTMGGPWTQLGSTATFGSTALSAGTGQPVQVGGGSGVINLVGRLASSATYPFSGMFGHVYEFRLYSGTTLEARPVFSAQTAGTSSFADSSSGNTWSLNGTAEISDRNYRFHGELASLTKTALPNNAGALAAGQAGGITRRLSQQQSPLGSSMYRYYTRPPASIALGEYWPCEDEQFATSIASANGGKPMQILYAKPSLAGNSDFASSAPLPVMNGASFFGQVTHSYAVTDCSIRALWEIPAGGETDGAPVLQATYSSGPVGYAILKYRTGGFLQMQTFTPGGSLIHDTGSVSFALNGAKFRVAMDLKQNGGNIDMVIATLTPNSGVVLAFTASAVVAGSVGRAALVQMGGAGLAFSVMGHLSVQGVADSFFFLAGALSAWNGEPAPTRIFRLCTEESVPVRIGGPQASGPAMGNQAANTFLELIQEAEATDQGILYEPRQAIGIGYIPARALQSQPPIATADMSAQQIDQALSAVSDDSQVVNDATLSTPGGSSFRSVVSSGPMSTAAPPLGIGRFDTTQPVNGTPGGGPDVVNVIPNPLLDDLAGWFTHVRSADEDRYPALPFELARPGQPSALAQADIGHYLPVNHPAQPWLPPGPIRALILGHTENIGEQPRHTVSFNVTAEAPYETAVADASHADNPGSYLMASVTSVATSLNVGSAVGEPWTTTGASFPFDLNVGGERMTCTGASSPAFNQITGTGFEDGLTDGYSPNNGSVANSTAQAHTGTHSLQWTLPGGFTDPVLFGPEQFAVAGVTYYSGGQVFSATTYGCRWTMHFMDMFGNFISAAEGPLTTLTASTWTQVQASFPNPAAPAGTALVLFGLHIVGTPAAGTLWLDDTGWGPGASQLLTVTRSVNGVVKAQTLSALQPTPVGLWNPAYAAL